MKRIVIATVALTLAISACGGGGDSGGDDDGGSDAPTTQAGLQGLAAEGEVLFQATCAACHGTEAEGIDGLGKALTNNEFVQERDTNQLLAFIQEGRLADHPDNTTGVAMPPRGGNPSLTDQDLVDIIAFVHSL